MSSRQSRELRRLLEKLEFATRVALAGFCKREGKTISCKKGCSACCYLLATGMPAEGVVLAEAVLARPDWLNILQRARECMLKGAKVYDRVEWMKLKLPCPVLDEATGACLCYNARTACCRFHFSISPVENCSLEATDTTVISPNLVEAEQAVWKFCMDHMPDPKLPIAGPIALVLLLGAYTILYEENDPRFKEVAPLVVGLPNCLDWSMGCIQNMDWNETDEEIIKTIVKNGGL